MNSDFHIKFFELLENYWNRNSNYITGVVNKEEIKKSFNDLCQVLVGIGHDLSNEYLEYSVEYCKRKNLRYHRNNDEWEDYYERAGRQGTSVTFAELNLAVNDDILQYLLNDLQNDLAMNFNQTEIMDGNKDIIDASNEWWRLQIEKYSLAFKYLKSELDVVSYIDSLPLTNVEETYEENIQIDDSSKQNENNVQKTLIEKVQYIEQVYKRDEVKTYSQALEIAKKECGYTLYANYNSFKKARYDIKEYLE